MVVFNTSEHDDFMNGFDVRENELGFTTVRLHYSADPSKNILHTDPLIAQQAQVWYEKTRRLFPDPNAWAQEMEINWWVASGTRVFPEFTETLHCQPVTVRARKVIYRAMDFGWHSPAVLIAQMDSKDRLTVMKEIVGRELTTSAFAHVLIDRCAAWFPLHAPGFQDFCDPAGQQVRPIENEKSEKRDVEILNGLGLYPSWQYGWSRKDGRALIHQLLRLRSDQTPSIYIDPTGCPILVQAFLGKYVYPESRAGQAKDEPDDTTHPWADVMACLRYLCTGLYTALGLRRFHYQPIVPEASIDYMGYGTKVSRDRSNANRA